MQKRMLKTNCPNCAGALQPDGNCPYCGTHVRFANELDIDGDNWLGSNQVEIMMRIKKGNEMIVMPIVGRIESISVSHSPCELPLVDLNFCGCIVGPDH